MEFNTLIHSASVTFISLTQKVPHLNSVIAHHFQYVFLKLPANIVLMVFFFMTAEMYTLCISELMNSHSEQQREASEVNEGIFVKNVKCLIMKTNGIFARRKYLKNSNYKKLCHQEYII